MAKTSIDERVEDASKLLGDLYDWPAIEAEFRRHLTEHGDAVRAEERAKFNGLLNKTGYSYHKGQIWKNGDTLRAGTKGGGQDGDV